MSTIERVEILKVLKDILATPFISFETKDNVEAEINSIINKIREDRVILKK